MARLPTNAIPTGLPVGTYICRDPSGGMQMLRVEGQMRPTMQGMPIGAMPSVCAPQSQRYSVAHVPRYANAAGVPVYYQGQRFADPTATSMSSSGQPGTIACVDVQAQGAHEAAMAASMRREEDEKPTIMRRNPLPAPGSSTKKTLERRPGTQGATTSRRGGDAPVEQDDYSDVLATGGINLAEESQNLQSRSARIEAIRRPLNDVPDFSPLAIRSIIADNCRELGVSLEFSEEIVKLMAMACERALCDTIESLAVIAEHRLENVRGHPNYELDEDVRAQFRFIEEVEKSERRRRDEEEKEALVKASKSRRGAEEDLKKIKAKVKDFQRIEAEHLQSKQTGLAAQAALGRQPGKRPKLDEAPFGSVAGSSSGPKSSLSSTGYRPRQKRVTVKDLAFHLDSSPEWRYTARHFDALNYI